MSGPSSSYTIFGFPINQEQRVIMSLMSSTSSRCKHISISFSKRVFTYEPKVLCSYFTYQYSDYGKYACSMWDESKKRAYRNEHFPADLRSAFEFGKEFGENCRPVLDRNNVD